MHEPLPAPFFPPPPLPAWLSGGQPPEKKQPDKDRDEDKRKDKERGPVRTQMIGESPGDDLGYDPKIIPTEKIPDQD